MKEQEGEKRDQQIVQQGQGRGQGPMREEVPNELTHQLHAQQHRTYGLGHNQEWSPHSNVEAVKEFSHLPR